MNAQLAVPRKQVMNEQGPMLSLLLPETNPVEEAKIKVAEISQILWYVHLWQEGETESLGRILRTETHLTKKQIRLLKLITKKSTEPEIISTVKLALYGE